MALDGTLLDRRRVELVDEGLQKLPHHNQGQAFPQAVLQGERMPPVPLEGAR
jgi:hypothetical protein